MVEEPLRDPNCCRSIIFFTSSISHFTAKSSCNFDTHEVSDIGLRSASPEMGAALGIGVMYECFHKAGNIPDKNVMLQISATGAADSRAKVFQTHWVHHQVQWPDNFLQTSHGLIQGRS